MASEASPAVWSEAKPMTRPKPSLISYRIIETRSRSKKRCHEPGASAGNGSGERTSPSATAKLSFVSLPELAHNMIASFLAPADMCLLFLVSRWARREYRRQVHYLVLRHYVGTDDDWEERQRETSVDWWPKPEALTSLLATMPMLRNLDVPPYRHVLMPLGDALRSGVCRKLSTLEVGWNEDVWLSSSAWRDDVAMWCGAVWLRTSMETQLMAPLQSLSLAVGVPRVLSSLAEALATGCCPSLQQLLLAGTLDSDDHVRELGDALGLRHERGGCRTLTHLKLNAGHRQLGCGIGHTLSSGVCQGLQALQLEGAGIKQADLDAVAAFVASPPAEQLTHLVVESHLLREGQTPGDAAGLANALANGGARNLGVLILRGCRLTGAPLQGLSDAVRHRGVWRSLRVLELVFGTVHTREDMDSLMAAIRDGHGCPSLKELRVTWCEEGQGPDQGGSCSAVCRSLDCFPVLDIMELSPIDGRETGALVASLASRVQAQRPLRKLLLSGLQDESVTALGEALRRQPCVDTLSSLSLGYCHTDYGMASLTRGLEAWAGTHLQVLYVHGCRVGRAGAGALFRALANGCCPGLQSLYVGDVHDDGAAVSLRGARDTAAALKRLLGGGRGKAPCDPGLRELGLCGLTRTDLHAVAQALGCPKATRLETLVLDMPFLPDDGMEAIGNGWGDEEMGAVVDGLRKGRQTRLQTLSLGMGAVSEVGVGELAEVISGGCCPEATRVMLGHGEWPVLRRAVKAAHHRRCGVGV